MATTYKLVYFDGRGRAEIVRLLFAVKGVEFEDKRIGETDWPKEKANAPQGAVPYLEIGGKLRLSQSLAITRYLAREYDLYGKSNIEGFYIDEIVANAEDLANAGWDAIFEEDETRKAKLMTKYKTETVEKYLTIINKAVEEKGKDGFAVSSSISFADLYILSTIENFKLDENDGLAKFPKLKANIQKTRENKNIEKWLKSRPATMF